MDANSSFFFLSSFSWGGIPTNYFVTHTGIFAAACSASGLGDLSSQYDGFGHSDFSHSGYEGPWMGNGEGKTIWEDTR